MWADTETYSDFLNYSEVAELTVDLLKDRTMQPLSIGIFGTWGTGKSTLLNLVEKQLVPGKADESSFIVVRFDAWLYQGYDDARAALMEVIATAFLNAAKELKNNEGVVEKATGFLKRVNYFRAIGLAGDGAAAFFGIPTGGLISRGLGAFDGLLDGNVSEKDIEAAKATSQEAKTVIDKLLKPEQKRTPPEEIAKFRAELAELLKALDKTLVVFVDNLDRCLPKQTIHTLEALRLFLFMEKTAFVVAADEEMVRRSVQSFFTEVDDRHVIDYLDKLVQVPVRVPKLGVQEVRAYMYMLFAIADGVPQDALERLRIGLETELRQSWTGKPIDRAAALKLVADKPSDAIQSGFQIADRLAPLLANSTAVFGNPRIVKRMMNVVRMRSRLASRRKIPMDEAMIAKLAIFERCMDATATADFYRLIQDAPDGKADIFRKLEQAALTSDEFKDACPESWWPRLTDFVENWLTLEPKLADIDLRPALYLSRETLPIRSVGGGMSDKAMEAFQILFDVKTQVSTAAKSVVLGLTAGEQVLVMEALIAEFRKLSDWNSRPPGFNGAQILAKETTTGPILGTFLRTKFDGVEMPPWLKAATKDQPWFKNRGAA